MKLIFKLIFLFLTLSYVYAETTDTLNVKDVRMANTHVIPIGGKSWEVKNKTVTLTLLSNRDALLLAKFDDQSLQYSVSVWNSDDVLLGTVSLNDPSKLPPTESNGTKYSTVHHSVMISKEWMAPKMKIQFSNSNNLKSDFIYPNVGQDINMKMWLLPFYLFGANDTNTQPLSVTGSINKAITDELIEKWSISSVDIENHSIKRIDWPYIILPPGRNGKQGLRITNSDQKRDGYEIMNVVLQLLSGIRDANGEGPTSTLYYSPLIHLGANGKYADPYGGLGGGSRGTGDYSYTGIFIHEAGHSFGLPHAGESYTAKSGYPYVNGSLLGSEWGYDKNHNEFLTINMPTTADYYRNCKNSMVLDSNGQCVKQSVMQGGAGDQSKGYRYSMFADYEMTTLQSYFGNGIYYDKTTGGYRKWNSTLLKYVPYTPQTQNGGLWGTDDNLPIERDVDIYTIIITHSFTNSSQLSQVYPPMKNKGNLRRMFDNTNATQLAEIKPNTSKYYWWCHNNGCDFTVRITYDDNSTQHILLQRGKRVWWAPMGAFNTGFDDPFNSNSFMTVTLNVKDNKKKITKVELFETLLGFNGFNINNSTLLVSQSF